MVGSQIRVHIDEAADAAYIELSKNKVVRTVEVTESILLDLDEFNIAVGVEVLELTAEIPFVRLNTEYHVHSDVVDLLRMIYPNVKGFSFRFTQGTDSQTATATDSVYAGTNAKNLVMH